MSDPVPRRRRRRRTRRARTDELAYEQQEPPMAAPASTRSALSQWEWRTFPVFFAFMLGIVVMGLVAPTPLGLIFYVGLFGVAYGVAHILTRMWVARRNR